MACACIAAAADPDSMAPHAPTLPDKDAQLTAGSAASPAPRQVMPPLGLFVASRRRATECNDAARAHID